MDTDFSAKESSLGYFYQIRYSLLLLLECEGDDTLVRLESLDDIDLITPDTVNLNQTKLHINSKPNITDASPDFWKTIRVWSESILQDHIDIEKAVLTLITTADIGATSFLTQFGATSKERNVSKIRNEMLRIFLKKILLF